MTIPIRPVRSRPFFGLIITTALLYSACSTPQTANHSQQAKVEAATVNAPQPDLAKFDAEVLAFEVMDTVNMPPENAILFVGSSSIRMWKSLAEDMAPLPVINRGFGGSTFPHLLHYADRLIKPYKPRAIVVYEGDNDISAETTTPDKVRSDLIAYQELVQGWFPGIKTYFLAIKPSIRRKNLLGKAQTTNALIAEYAATEETLEYIDISTPMMESEDKIRSDIFIQDSLHMNAKGYEIWTSVVRPIMMDAFGEGGK